MLCKDVAKTQVDCVGPKDPATKAARIMLEHNVGFLPVCEANGTVLGTVTDRDLAIRLIAENKSPNTPIENVMSREVVACKPTDDLRQAEELMANKQKSRVLCVENGKLVGVISLSDIAKHDASNAVQILQKVSAREVQA